MVVISPSHVLLVKPPHDPRKANKTPVALSGTSVASLLLEVLDEVAQRIASRYLNRFHQFW